MSQADPRSPRGQALRPSSDEVPHRLDRRRLLHAVAAGALLPMLPGAASAQRSRPALPLSIVYWCFHQGGSGWDIDRLCAAAKELGCSSIELVPPEHWGRLRQEGLSCAIAPNGVKGGAFKRGLNNRALHEEVLSCTKEAIEQAAAAGFPAVIAFMGYRWRDPGDPTSGDISREEGREACVEGLRALAQHAEKHGVNLCLEHLNTRDDTHPMKGHPGYQGDDLDEVSAIVREVASERVRLLFDVYHVQVMHGDILRRLEECRDILGHVHVAGCPGRGELSQTQELNYPAVTRKLVELGYRGHVGLEFIPTADPMAGLREAVAQCGGRSR